MVEMVGMVHQIQSVGPLEKCYQNFAWFSFELTGVYL